MEAAHLHLSIAGQVCDGASVSSTVRRASAIDSVNSSVSGKEEDFFVLSVKRWKFVCLSYLFVLFPQLSSRFCRRATGGGGGKKVRV